MAARTDVVTNRGRPQRLLTHDGKTQSLSAWAREIGVTKQRLHQRLKACPVAEALDPDYRQHHQPRRNPNDPAPKRMITIRCTPDEVVEIAAAAFEQKVSMNTFVLRAALEACPAH